ncbi:hypothetical protein [Coprobacter secundus]|uniref:Uncharacterized protein n=1 Tax=Coprobacter secundus subsp. similis TaxID=2751153 RepID=A0A7G1HTS3_9BACT|nr:hypothetical protein [Coprobacter secundus]BCI62162.1 hypothetical protein Cop2CBH44_05150 [Coprobacter secundus subsp. similis]
MKHKKIYKRRFLSLQTLGLLPGFIVMLANNYITERETVNLSLWIGISLFFWLLFRKIKGFHPLYMFFASAITLVGFSFLKLYFYNSLFIVSNTVIIFILYLISLISVRDVYPMIRNFLRRKFSRKIKNGTEVYEFNYISKILLYGFSLYLTILILFNVEGRELYPGLFRFLNYYLNLILILIFFIYDIIRFILLNKMLSKETWLPIIDKNMNVTGCIEEQASLEAGKRYTHPHIRIIALCGSKIYLQKNNNPLSISEAAVDTPFSYDLKYGESVEESIDRVLSGLSESPHLAVRQLLKTKYEKENMSRIILLCVLNVKNEDDLERIANLKGWFWNNSHIEDNLNHHIFSECFEQEFEFLKNTILLAYQYKAENTIK